MAVEVRGLSAGYGGRRVLNRISFSVGPGQVAAVLGPNGAGKSTLLRCILGVLKPEEGAVLLEGCDAGRLTPRDISEKIAYIPQVSVSAFPYSVFECVLMGVTGRLRLFESPGPGDEQAVLEALKRLGIAHLKDRPCTDISGGERQLMLVARALTQRARVLLWDEPTASLDYGNSHAVMERAADLSREGFTVLFSTHQPEFAFRYATRALALCGGELLADGPPEQVLTQELLEQLYRTPILIRSVDTPSGTRRVVIPEPKGESSHEER